jgi:hypothetical protein
VGDACSSSGAGCGSGLHCSACGAGGDSICTRASPVDPATHGTGLPFNNYSWLTTHNSYALAGAASATGSALITETNQEDTVTAQLKVTATTSLNSHFHFPSSKASFLGRPAPLIPSPAEVVRSGQVTASAIPSDAGAAAAAAANGSGGGCCFAGPRLPTTCPPSAAVGRWAHLSVCFTHSYYCRA